MALFGGNNEKDERINVLTQNLDEIEKENRALKMQLKVYEEEYENIEIIKEKFEKITRENQDFMGKLKEAEDKYKEVEERTHDVIKEISEERDKYKGELNNERSKEIIEIRQFLNMRPSVSFRTS